MTLASVRRAARPWLAAFTLLLAVATAGLAQQAVPPLEGRRVVDLTGTLSAEAVAALDAKLAAFEARKGSQIAVLLVESTAPEAIEPYSLRVAEAWRLGREGVDDGVLFLAALGDRRMRFEVGYGLEGAVPDALARRIIAETIAPRFYEGDFAGGLDALIGVIDGEPLPVPVAREPDVEPFAALPFVLFFAAVLAPVFRRTFGALPGSAVLGTGVGVVVWLVSSVLIASIAAGVFVFVLALAGVGGPGRWSSGRGGWGGGFPGGFGGGRGGGGFRGGGGRFGGGGASGGW